MYRKVSGSENIEEGALTRSQRRSEPMTPKGRAREWRHNLQSESLRTFRVRRNEDYSREGKDDYDFRRDFWAREEPVRLVTLSILFLRAV